jgi:DNA polymerase-3 subunit chi
MQVDFYQLSRDPAEAAVTMLADRTIAAGARMLVVAEDPARLDRIGEALWNAAGRQGEARFLANGRAGGAHDARQPILLAAELVPANGARYLALADGIWRETEGFARVFLIFDEVTLAGARTAWKELGQREGLTRNFWKQEDGRWLKAG